MGVPARRGLFQIDQVQGAERNARAGISKLRGLFEFDANA